MILFFLFLLNKPIIGVFNVKPENEVINLLKDCCFNFAQFRGEEDTNKLKEKIIIFKENNISLIIDDIVISHLASLLYYSRKVNNLPIVLFQDFINFNIPGSEREKYYFRIKIKNYKRDKNYLVIKNELEEILKRIPIRIKKNKEFIFAIKGEDLIGFQYIIIDLEEKEGWQIESFTIYTSSSDSLLKGYFDRIIKERVNFYERFIDKDFQIYLYLSDETRYYQYLTTRYMKDRIEEYSNKKITGLSHLPFITKDYCENVKPNFLWVDIYHNIGRNADFNLERTPEPEDTNFIYFLEDLLIRKLDSVRKYSLIYNIPFIYEAPAFSEACYIFDNLVDYFPPYKKEWDDSVKRNSEEEGAYREISEEELNCIINLALLYGAKGIFYWHFLPLDGIWQFQYGKNKGKYKYYYLNGMVKRETLALRPVGEYVKKINKRLRIILEILKDFTSKQVFSCDRKGFINENPLFLFYTNYPYLHFGILENGKRKYLMIVEKGCEKSIKEAKIYLKRELKFYDIWEKKLIDFQKKDKYYYFKVKLKGGEGKIFEIID